MGQRRINRNIVECKDSFSDCLLVPLLVLIETLWNVKMTCGAAMVFHLFVLIETLWNVKSCNNFFGFFLRAGINRNIVECKDRQTIDT